MVDDKRYTAKEVDDMVARQLQQQEVKNLHNAITAIQSTAVRQYSELTNAVDNLGSHFDNRFNSMQTHVDDCRDELRKEIEKDFITKPEFMALEGKVERMWVKIATAVISAMAVLNIVFEIWRGMGTP